MSAAYLLLAGGLALAAPPSAAGPPLDAAPSVDEPAPPAEAALPPPAAGPPPVVVVRPLPVRERPALRPGYTKSELIAASWVDRTVSITPIGPMAAEDGAWPAEPAAFTCTVQANQLTVSYTREGFDTARLPRFGTCVDGDASVRFGIEVEGRKR